MELKAWVLQQRTVAEQGFKPVFYVRVKTVEQRSLYHRLILEI